MPRVGVMWNICDTGEIRCSTARRAARTRGEEVADGVGFEPTRRSSRLPVFKTGALNRSATHPR